ncbi:MAG: hypothetical protein AAF821_21190 [Cyanobacteria bacterium P01_D01_bin.156]
MNDLEMELQTIRQKLQTIKASPPETVTPPWRQPQNVSPSPQYTQVKTAIDTLRQRSEQPHTLATVPKTSLQQFQDLLATNERLALQQQQTLEKLCRVGNDLMQQEPIGTSSNIDKIARFLRECPNIQVPTIKRTPQDYLELAYRTVNFRQANEDALYNAAKLRTKSQLFQQPFTPNSPYIGHDDNYIASDTNSDSSNLIAHLLDDLKRSLQLTMRPLKRLIRGQAMTRSQRSKHIGFSSMDSAIWCVGAAIARIVLNRAFQFYPGLWTPVALIIIVGVMLGLYSSLFSPNPNPSIGYRTLMVILGLILGGRFSA